MSDYLTNYGVKESKQERKFLRVVAAVVGTVVVGAFLWFYFRTFREERAVKQFLSNLAAKNYQAGYEQFGCSATKPCRDYQFEKFLEDWGDNSPFADVSKTSISLAEVCGNSVWVSLKQPGQSELGLAVDPDTRQIGFSPDPRCPHKWRLSEFPGKLMAFVKRRM